MYKTIYGEMFDEIAYNQLGSCRYVAHLIESNYDFVDVFIFDDNVELTLPTIEEIKPMPKKLPAWRILHED